MRKILLLLIVSSISVTGLCQDFSNKGKDFWLVFPAHVPSGAQQAQMGLFITSDKNSSGTITVNGFSTTFTVTANQITGPIDIPYANANVTAAESNTVVNKGIHVKTNPGQPAVVLYAHIYAGFRSEASLILPKNTLGKKYYSMNFWNASTGSSKSQFQIVAVDQNTTVQIQIVKNGVISGVPFSVTLPNEGDVYQYQPPETNVDISGSYIETIAGSVGECKKIAVFSGSSALSISRNGCSAGSYDPLYQQCYPISSWGKEFGVVPFLNNGNGYHLRIMASENNTTVNLNGTIITLNAGEYYPATTPNPTSFLGPKLIIADKPIAVAQYLLSGNCSGSAPIPGQQPQGDPDMIILNPVEQSINDINIFSSNLQSINTKYLCVYMKTIATGSFRINNALPINSFFPMPQNNGYSYLAENLTLYSTQSFRIQADSGFNAITYGMGGAESYGYSAGTNVKDLYQQIGVSTQYGIESTPSVCTGSPFKFKISLPYCADSLRWDLSNLPGPPVPAIDTIRYTACTVGPGGADSSTVVNGKTLYWYSLPNTFSFSTIGVYPVTITAYTTGASACGNEQDIDFELQVSDPPAADFTWVAPGCPAELVSFFDITNSAKPTYKWWWDFGDPASGASNNSALKSPVHTFSAPGTYTVRYANITTPGCLSDTIPHQVVVPKFPTATISGATTVCINDPVQSAILFTAAEGKAPYTFTYNIDAGAGPGPNLTVSSTGTGNTATVLVPTNIAGTFTYNLVNVGNTSFAACNQNITGQQTAVTITPDATINLGSAAGTDNQTICINTPAANITYTIGGSGTGGSVTGLPAGITGSFAAGVITITGTPSVSGVFNYTVTTTGPCVKPSAAGIITVTADATIALLSAPATASQSLCLNTTITNITYAVGGTGTGGTVTGLPAGVTGTYAAGVITISGTPSASGTFNYTVNTAGPCGKPTAVGTITVYALPTLNFTSTAPSCETRLIGFTDNSNPNVGTLTNWAWNFGDLNSTATNPNTSTIKNPLHTFSVAGSYTVGLTVITSNGCTNPTPFTKVVTVNDRPKAGFIVPEVCINDVSAIFTDTSKIAVGAFNAAGYEWDFGDPASGAANTSTTKDGTHLYTLTGSYTVRHIVTSALGCKDTSFNNIFINGADPLANFSVTNAAALCANDSVGIVNLSTIGQGSITKVEIYWDFAGAPAVIETDDFPSPNKVYKHKYPNFQTPLTRPYTIRFRAYSGTLCQDVIAKPITVNAAPKVQFNAMPDACLDAAPFQVTQASEIGGVPGTAVYTGPGVNATGLFNPALAGVGTHRIKYTFTSSAAGCVDTISRLIKVPDTATAKFSLVTPVVCQGNAVTFKEESTAPAGVILTSTVCDFGDGATGTFAPGSTFSHTYAVWGTYTVKLYNISAYGCKSTVSTKQIYVSPNPVPLFSFDQSSVCLPNALVSVKNNSTIPDNTALTYLWDFGDGSNTSAALAPTHVYSGKGPYTVTLIVKSSSNCSNTLPLVVNFIHPQPRAAFDFSKPEVCVGQDVVFNDLTDGLDGTVVKWNWDFGDLTTGNSRQAPHLYTTAKTFDVSLYIVNSQGCNSDTLTKPFTVHPYPVVDAGPDRVVLEGGSLTLQPAVTGNDLQYLWSPPTYLDNVNIAAPTAVNVLNDITYTLVVTGRGGCTAPSDKLFVKVLKAPQVPNTFTPNNDGINDFWKIEYLDSYPNNRIQVFTRTGQLVFESKGYKTPWNGTLNGKPLPVDTYYYIIEPENGRKAITGYVTILK
jgi:gliding motility-associated-like protein